MQKIFRWLQTYLLYGLPFVLIVMAWGSLQKDIDTAPKNLLQRVLWEILGWNIMIWFTALIIFLAFIVFYKLAQEQVLKRIANIKERDEREEYITGKASRRAYISTLSILIFLLFISIFNLQIYKLPPDKANGGKTGTVSIGLGFDLFDTPKVQKSVEGDILFQSNDIPLSKSGILLLVIIWQIVSFNMSARKELVIEK